MTDASQRVDTINLFTRDTCLLTQTYFFQVTIVEIDLGKIAPTWVRDDAVTMCMACTIPFTTIRRRHHCRACGKIVCSNCSSYKAPLEYDNNKVNRVCVNCYAILTKGQAGNYEKRKESMKRKKIPKFGDAVMSGYLNFRSDNTKTFSKRWCMLGKDFTFYVFKAKKVGDELWMVFVYLNIYTSAAFYGRLMANLFVVVILDGGCNLKACIPISNYVV